MTKAKPMQEFAIQDDTLTVHPSATSSKHDFDIYVGQWKITNRRLKSRLTNSDQWHEFEADQEMELILNGFGNTDTFLARFDGKPFEGRTIRLFDPNTRLWSLYWADSDDAALQTPTIGSFHGDTGRFYCLDTHNGQQILVRFEWDKNDTSNPVWRQAFSTDLGKSWEHNWYMYSRPALVGLRG